jgi:hypothetical protein
VNRPAELLAAMPEDPLEAHAWLIATVGSLDEIAAVLERAYQACDDPDERETIRGRGIEVERLRATLMEKASELLAEVAPAPVFVEAARVLREQARADRRNWDAAARAHARGPALVPVLLARARTAARQRGPAGRRGHTSATERAPPRPDDPDDVDPPAEAAA